MIGTIILVACFPVMLWALMAAAIVVWEVLRDIWAEVRSRFDRSCDHAYWQSCKTVAEDGTPMMGGWCPECGHRKEWEVQTNPETWLEG